ncbi:MAG: hypothetical protein ACLRWQ_12205 [Flavonifractor plautii]
MLNQDNEITRGFAVSARGRVTRFSRREELEQGVFGQRRGHLDAQRHARAPGALPGKHPPARRAQH